MLLSELASQERHLCFRQHGPHLIYRAEESAIPPNVPKQISIFLILAEMDCLPPERRLHTGVQAQRTVSLDNLPDDIPGSGVRTAPVLQSSPHVLISNASYINVEGIPDFHEFERHDHKALRGACTAPGQHGQALRHLFLPRHLQERLSPEIVGGARGGGLWSDQATDGRSAD
jgi:hypothetical protein